jgi:hypothetical protein
LTRIEQVENVSVTERNTDRRITAMRTLARIAADAPRHAVEDAAGLAALCLMVAAAFSLSAIL